MYISAAFIRLCSPCGQSYNIDVRREHTHQAQKAQYSRIKKKRATAIATVGVTLYDAKPVNAFTTGNRLTG